MAIDRFGPRDRAKLSFVSTAGINARVRVRGKG